MSAASRPAGISWNWSLALLGAVYALPGAVVALSDVQEGLALAVGVVPAAILGVPPRRRGRLILVLLALLTGPPAFIGAVLAGVPVLAVAGIGLAAVGAVWLTGRSPLGMLATNLSLPMMAVGFSYPDLSKAATMAGLMIGGSLYAAAVAQLWPQRPARPAAPHAAPPLDYGVRLGLAAATAAAIGFAAGLEHVGWATVSAVIVMRPDQQLQASRSVARLLAVLTGAVLAILLVESSPPDAVYAFAALATLAGAAATSGSRWYVTAAFTTFMVFLLLLSSAPQDAESRFLERIGETALGVGIAFFFGIAVPRLGRYRSQRTIGGSS